MPLPGQRVWHGADVWYVAAWRRRRATRMRYMHILLLPNFYTGNASMRVQVGKEGVITVADGKTMENELEVSRAVQCGRCSSGAHMGRASPPPPDAHMPHHI